VFDSLRLSIVFLIELAAEIATEVNAEVKASLVVQRLGQLVVKQLE
jgi:hypothetical protein